MENLKAYGGDLGEGPAQKKKAKKRKGGPDGKHAKKAKDESQLPPPLPELFAAPLEEKEGRVRHVAHTPGLWASHFAIPAPVGLREDLLQAALSGTPHQDGVVWSPLATFHMSLTRTFYLHRHEVDILPDALRDAHLTDLPPLSLTFDRVGIFTNEEGTTAFLALLVARGAVDPVLELLARVDDVVEGQGLEKYWSPPLPHISVATAPLRSGVSVTTAYTKTVPLANPISFTAPAAVLSCGNKRFTYQFDG
eukprot:Sspe_Gene.24319::Locus_9613_Transcript_1_1_Confidence_1.000_Length_833::g.24319::m.24319